MYSGLEGVYGGLDGPRSYPGGDKYDRRPGINPVNRELTSCEGKVGIFVACLLSTVSQNYKKLLSIHTLLSQEMSSKESGVIVYIVHTKAL